MVEQTILNKAITGVESIIDVPFNTYGNSIGFQFTYSNLNGDTNLMPQISLNNGVSYDDFVAGQITLKVGNTSEAITITDVRSNYAFRWKVLASSASEGTIESVYVNK
jgi:hypothetical protein